MKKYCCLNLSFLPSNVESFGYRSLEIFSALFFSSSDFVYFCSLNSAKSNSFMLSHCQRRRVENLRVLKDIIGIS